MDIKRWQPEELQKIREEVDLISDLSQKGNSRFLASGALWMPPADWFQTENDLILVIDAPGIDPNSIELFHDEQEITVVARRMAQDFGQPLQCERPVGGFERHFALPEAIEPDSAEAQYRLGQLEVRFRKLGKTITIDGDGL